ncbi:cholinesterase [Aspergillus eucalypticola CBS 122712]|uniref:Carboxylic ester hydrolase n=1 Tax=Aspergillus eucalypticola (strain CBS 122712 / IBT 29274) TaxID=1448314 RepID=A0A317UWZ2_ASPEC|nr:cholinesterase [Aspergillus eucalypticola CBS 122712]PWY65057.1 cholinesterase [Aspergillus eucalypticola CBS 122712]
MRFPYQWALFDATNTWKHLDSSSPVVTAPSPSATITGENEDTNVQVFKGIPYAKPPVGTLRLQPPEPITTDLSTVQATDYPAACPQQDKAESKCAPLPPNVASLLGPTTPNPQSISEDCLTLNIWRPADAKLDSKLPVLFWIYGGSFEVGSSMDLSGTPIVNEAIKQSMPIIFVSANYRLGGFGFLPGKEVKDAGVSNLGLQDQRQALKWVADNIESFGGDPDKVTIWGQSAGAHSVFHQMALYNGDITYNEKPLFRGGIMNSGNTWPVNPVDGTRGQEVYEQVVDTAGCSLANDTLSCLRDLPYEDFLKASNSVPSRSGYYALSLSYLPRPDGKVVTASPEEAASTGAYAKVPFIVGNPEDDGSAVVLNLTNITTQKDVGDYLRNYYFLDASEEQIDELVSIYNDDDEYGAPFHTPSSNSLYPQSKRLAAILGDVTVLQTRRFILSYNQENRPDNGAWSFISSIFKGIPFLGTFHGSELYIREVNDMLVQNFPDLFTGDAERVMSSIWSYYLSFITYQDPNKSNPTVQWPQWGEGKNLMHFGRDEDDIIVDDFRANATSFIVENVASLHL